MAENSRERRLDGWGYLGEEVPPSKPLLKWLKDRLGPATPPGWEGSSGLSLPEPASLVLPVPVFNTDGDRLANARGQAFPDIVRLRSGDLPALPDGITRPDTADDVARLLDACGKKGVRLIPRGGGTSVTGGVNILSDERPALVLSLENISALEDLDPLSGLATMGAGATGPQVEGYLQALGWTLGHFPQSWELSTLGGWVVTRSSGQESLAYGRIDDLVAGLELQAPGGRVRIPALPATASGPDPRHLVLGSEGRFGVVTRVTVRIRPRPEPLRVDACLVGSWEDGVEAARRLVQDQVPLSLLRLSDRPETEVAMAVGLASSPLAMLARLWLSLRRVGKGCLLLVGAPRDRAPAFRQVAATLAGIRHVSLGARPGEKWIADRFRHPYLRDGLLDHGYGTDTLETAAPWARLPGLANRVGRAIEEALDHLGESVAVLCHLSHPYRDGSSLYFTFFFRCPESPAEAIERWAIIKRAATDVLADEAVALTHHHGVGSFHAPWLHREQGETMVEALKAVAKSLDPQEILNPHVLLDPRDRLES